MGTMRYPDPFEGMSDEEFENEFFEALERDPLKPISLRLPTSTIERSKAAAKERGVPYQALIKGLIEAGLNRLDRPPRRRAS
jgi:predicted DNA binding CopG/RHH family protein